MSFKLYRVTCELPQQGDYGSLRERLRTLGAQQMLTTSSITVTGSS